MSVLAVQLPDGVPIPAIGQTFTTDRGEAGTVVMSNPGTTAEQHILVEVPDEQLEHALHLLSLTGDTVGDARPQHGDYLPQWLGPKTVSPFDLEAQAAVRDTFEASGFTDEVLDALTWDGLLEIVIDTGIRSDHDAFAGLEVYQWGAAGTNNGTDLHGHGTFVCSQRVGRYGVSGNRQLAVFQGLPGTSGAGTELSVSQAVQAAGSYYRQVGARGAVASLSLGGSTSGAIRGAVEALAALPGMVVYVAAGNGGPDQAQGSPADARGVGVVGAADRSWRATDFSGGGPNAAWVTHGQFGLDIIGANKDGGLTSSSGTSMSTPFAAGAASCHLATGRSKEDVFRLTGSQRQHQLAPPGRWGVVQLDRADFVAAEPPAPPEEDERQYLIAMTTEALRVVNEARYVTRAHDEGAAFDQFGAVADYLGQMLTRLVAGRVS